MAEGSSIPMSHQRQELRRLRRLSNVPAHSLNNSFQNLPFDTTGSDEVYNLESNFQVEDIQNFERQDQEELDRNPRSVTEIAIRRSNEVDIQGREQIQQPTIRSKKGR